MSGGFGETSYYQLLTWEKFLEGLVKLVITSYRPGEMPGGFGETWYNQL